MVLSPFTPHSFYVLPTVLPMFLKNSVYELHLGTKTLTCYCDHRVSFNGICYPPPLNIDGVEPEHSKSLLIGITPSNELEITTIMLEHPTILA